MRKGAFTFVLHSHLPYCRRAGQWPHGEEWLHEAASESYLPLLKALCSLREGGSPFKLTLGLTPVLVEQIADPLVCQHFETFMEDKLHRATADEQRFQKAGESHRASLAQFYFRWYEDLLRDFRETFHGDLIGSFRRLQEEGFLQVVTSAATHAYLPLLERDSSIYAQLSVGSQSYRRHFGQDPQAAWLPECGYRPPYYVSEGGSTYMKPGLEQFLAGLGIGCFFAETHTVEGGEPVGKAKGEALGPYGDIPKRYVVPLTGYPEPTQRTTYQPYWVGGVEVAVLGRNNRTGMQVWSAEHGYPGDYSYREFHKRDGVSGLQYWKITGVKAGLGEKELYDPQRARERVRDHAAHYASLVEELLVQYYESSGNFGIIVAAYDTELFGHWWFEGVEWLRQVLERLSRSQVVELTTPSRYLAQHPPEEVLALPEGSWGQAGNHFTWLNTDTQWMWPLIHEAEGQMEGLVARYPRAQGTRREALNQAGRELLLLQSSDWPFLITTGQAREYATYRFQEHLARFRRLAETASSAGDGMGRTARELYELDKLFPDLDYRLFARREGQ